MKIKEILLKLAPVMTAGVIQPNGIREDFDTNESKREQARLAIYKAGLEAIGEDEHDRGTNGDFWVMKRNELRATQRQAWAQLCGIEGESE